MALNESFNKLAENNKDKDWNDPVFRQTMVNAFGWCARKFIDERERIFNINLDCAREGAREAVLEELKHRHNIGALIFHNIHQYDNSYDDEEFFY